jgi:hypothetical protein|tara:strand:+ start:262 stop:687 length:426 start_codon:yes stop_codon:yes gene_type:complete
VVPVDNTRIDLSILSRSNWLYASTEIGREPWPAKFHGNFLKARQEKLMIQFIAIGPNVWGRGDTITAALKTMRSVGSAPKAWIVKRVDADMEEEPPFVDQFGALNWHDVDGDQHVKPVTVAYKKEGKAAEYGEALNPELPL